MQMVLRNTGGPYEESIEARIRASRANPGLSISGPERPTAHAFAEKAGEIMVAR